MAEKKKQIPLKDLNTNIDLANMDFYDNLPEDLQKAFSPWLAMRWASSVQNKQLSTHYLTMINDFCNNNFTLLSKHPGLFWKLLTMAGVGKTQFHKWIPPGKKTKKSKVQEFLASIYPTYKLEDLQMIEKVNSKAELKALAKNYGYDDKEIKEMFK
jgi:hypothetical protein